ARCLNISREYRIQAQSKTQTGIYFVDATTIDVCHVKRAASNRVFKGIAKKGKSSKGWFFGFKLHLVINDKGEIMAYKLTQATTDVSYHDFNSLSAKSHHWLFCGGIVYS
ncbi:MAG: hypothetical protein QG556_644, partial [Pseudomonadota bacterium]|nr:hypothetical protein [Pseudomonadota bacterium]